MDAEVEQLLAAVTPAVRRRDAERLIPLMTRATGEQPWLWGRIVGFGSYHYRYPSGREGDAPGAAFAARKAATVVYLNDGVEAHRALVEQLGEHSSGVGCLYLKDLDRVDLTVLEQVVARSYAALTASTYTERAHRAGD